MSKQRIIIFILAAALMMFVSMPSIAAKDDTEELKKQIELLQKRVEHLESEQKSTSSQSKNLLNRNHSFGWDPFEEMERMQEEMDKMFQNSFNRLGHRKRLFSSNMSIDDDFDLKETKKGYEIEIDMQGLDKEKIDIEINEHSVTVKGEHSTETQEKNQNSFFRSQSFGSFMKTIPLPVDADTTKAKTEKKEDSLIIKFPRKS